MPPMPTFYIKRGDTLPVFFATLRDGKRQPVDLSPVGTSVLFRMRAEVGGPPGLGGAASIIDDGSLVKRGQVQYAWQTADTAVEGIFVGEFRVTYQNGTIETFPNNSFIRIVVVPNVQG